MLTISIRHSFSHLVKKCFSALTLVLMVACGGGGDGPASPATVVLIGQVVKGLTSGTTVQLFGLSDSGDKTQLASGMTDAQGEFRLTYTLQAGHVYLLEAQGGQYVNEISGVPETLTTPLRAVFVASGKESHFTVSALSEAVVQEVEQTSGPLPKWQAAAISAATQRIQTALGMTNVTNHKFVDLVTLSAGNYSALTPEQVALSLHVGFFAGYWQELQLRSPGVSLSQALRGYHASILDTGNDITEASITQFAGIVRFLEKLPTAISSEIYLLFNLPSDANSDVFSGAETSGQASSVIPNRTLRLTTDTTASTFFNGRGAMVATRLGTNVPQTSLMHSGFSSVADVYGDSEIAIGRWNKGYYYADGVTLDEPSDTFKWNNASLQPLLRDFIYAAGVPATNSPSCGTVTMAPAAQTKALRLSDGQTTLTLDPSSRLGFYHSSGSVYLGYNIVLRNAQSKTYTFATTGGADAPWQGIKLGSNNEFGSGIDWQLPGGDNVRFQGLLAGKGATKAVISLSHFIKNENTRDLSAAFVQTGPVQPCAQTAFAAGSVDPVPVSGAFGLLVGSDIDAVISNLDFFSNGTPNPVSTTGLSASSGVERTGNGVVGIGILTPPFSTRGVPAALPEVYYYVSAQPGPDFPTSGAATYRLIASTPVLVKNSVLVSSTRLVSNASLSVTFGQFPLGVTSTWYGTCVLTVEGLPSPGDQGQFYPGGSCRNSTGLSSFTGEIPPANPKYAVMYYRVLLGSSRAEVALLFEKNP